MRSWRNATEITLFKSELFVQARQSFGSNKEIKRKFVTYGFAVVSSFFIKNTIFVYCSDIQTDVVFYRTPPAQINICT